MPEDFLVSRWIFLWIAIGALCGAELAAQASPRELTLEAALARVEASSPELRAAAAEVEQARGRLLGARIYPHNPVLEVEAADRSGPGGSSTDRGLSVSQEIELAGQRGKRVAAAQAALAAAEARYARRRREVTAAVERAFAETVRGRQLVEVARTDVELTHDLLDSEERRLEAGAGTRIGVNLARAAAGRAIHRLQQATAAWREGRARVAEAVGLDPSSPPEVSGPLPTAPASLPALEELVDLALESRQDLAAAGRERERAEREIALQRSLSKPHLELGVFSAREEGDDILGLGVGVSLPIFDRNQGAIVEARALADRAGAIAAAAGLTATREVASAYGRYQAAAGALTALQGLVVETLEETLDLLRKAVDAGELSATDVLLLRRELVEGRREQIEAASELWLARIDLELAVGADLHQPTQEEAAHEN